MSSCLSDPFAPAWMDDAMPCAVIDIQSELRFWEETYARQSFHRPGTPFRHYVPTLKFAYDIYLLSHRRSLEELLPSLPSRYEAGILRGVRLDWPLAHAVIARVWERLNAPLEEDAPLFAPPVATVVDERALLAEAMNKAGTRTITQRMQR
ncbi:hypothetical protein FB548_2380 [Pseudoxanthomonas sp. 3HH-4]|nr:hypothetical protein FB548_2380 [Pseudoxanthomonas sp. 3HH-4]